MPGGATKRDASPGFTSSNPTQAQMRSNKLATQPDHILALASSEARVFLTEDKDFGQIAYRGGHQTAGVVLIRFPAGVRSALGQAILAVVNELGKRITAAFTVVQPGRARVSRRSVPDQGRKSTDK
jgi:predicted nuclease of predicted toxin-antitoxin system